MDLAEFRKRAAELSGGTSSEQIRALVLRCLDDAGASGRLLDFGAGRGELLCQLHGANNFSELAGADLFARPADLPASISWYQQDLNEALDVREPFDVVVCSETIEHLENPRHTMRNLHRLLRPGGVLVLTMPNQESLRSIGALLLGGHFAQFLGQHYPAHITALLHMDMERLCEECGFTPPEFRYTDYGGVPKAVFVTWQRVSFGLLRGRLFSDNLALITKRIGAEAQHGASERGRPGR
jgi:2-polyprenyl-3-methyl-5-hydroxy-6-metoxy-1,4-benzoquinol methylase